MYVSLCCITSIPKCRLCGRLPALAWAGSADLGWALSLVGNQLPVDMWLVADLGWPPLLSVLGRLSAKASQFSSMWLNHMWSQASKGSKRARLGASVLLGPLSEAFLLEPPLLRGRPRRMGASLVIILATHPQCFQHLLQQLFTLLLRWPRQEGKTQSITLLHVAPGRESGTCVTCTHLGLHALPPYQELGKMNSDQKAFRKA